MKEEIRRKNEIIDKLESDMRENQKMAEQLKMANFERENLKNEMAKMRQSSTKLESELKKAKEMIEQLKTVKFWLKNLFRK